MAFDLCPHCFEWHALGNCPLQNANRRTIQEQPGLANIIPLKKQMVRVVMREGGGWFDMDKPDDFNMLAFMTSVRATGHIMNDHMYVPLDMIASIFIWSQDNPPKMEGGGAVVPFGNKT
jgi:hypothetical protein